MPNRVKMSKSNHQEVQLKESMQANDAGSRAIAAEPWVFWAIAAQWILLAVTVLYWIGIVGYSPLDLIQKVGGWWLDTTAFDPSEMPRFADGPLWFIREFVAGLSWALLILPFHTFFRYRIGIIEAGSAEAYRQIRREETARASTPTAVGTLLRVSIAKGGILTSSETLIETSEGFFRISGMVDTVKKGDPVFTLGSQLLIGVEGGQKRYPLVS